MKPVTELWNAAFEVWDESEEQDRPGLARLGRAVVALQDAKHGGCLEVLDLVATLPPERLEEVRRCVDGHGEKSWRAALGPWNDDGVSVATCIGLMRRTLDAYKGLPQITSPQLGLVRWVVGLDPLVLRSMRQWLNGMRAIAMGPWAEGCRAAADGLESALSGGEGPAKCPECHGAGKVKRLEGGGSIRVVKYDPCPKCAEGEGGSKEEAKPTTLPAGKPQTHTGPCVDYCACRSSSDVTARKTDCQACEWGMPMYDRQWRALPGRIWCRHQHEYDQMLGAAEKAQHVERRMLPAGKPPPFLQVGMRLRSPLGEIWRVEAMHDVQIITVTRPGRGPYAIREDELSHWTLEEPFTVEGETAPAERRKPCTCNSSPSPRRCEGQSRLGEGWYCVEGKP